MELQPNDFLLVLGQPLDKLQNVLGRILSFGRVRLGGLATRLGNVLFVSHRLHAFLLPTHVQRPISANRVQPLGQMAVYVRRRFSAKTQESVLDHVAPTVYVAGDLACVAQKTPLVPLDNGLDPAASFHAVVAVHRLTGKSAFIDHDELGGSFLGGNESFFLGNLGRQNNGHAFRRVNAVILFRGVSSAKRLRTKRASKCLSICVF